MEFGRVKRPAELSKLLGVDVRGFKHGVSNQALAHMKGKHPDLTDADLGRLPEVVESGRASRAKDSGVNGVPRVLYRAKIGGIRYEYVAEYRRRKQRLDAITFYRV